MAHRDVKPENLFLLKSGWLKMLDFGLARLTTVGDETDRPTMAVLTEARRILGTLAHDGDAEAEYLADDFTAAVINRLSQVPGLRVVPRSTVFQFKGRDIDLTSAALALNAQSLVTGRVTTREQTVSVQAELIDAKTQDQVWGHQYRHDLSGILPFEEEVAEHLGQMLAVRLVHKHKRRLRRQRPDDVTVPPAAARPGTNQTDG